MNTLRAVLLACVVAGAGCAHYGERVSVDPLPDGQHLALEAVAAYEFGDSREPLTAVEDLVKQSLSADDEAAQARLAAHLAAMLESDAVTLDAKQFICRQLWLIGSEENVAAIAPLLYDPATANMARYALERIPGNEVNRALLDALDETEGEVQAGIIGTLAARKVDRAVPRFRDLATDPDPVVARAAADALASMGR
ncbi:MAG: HEAT repeat domain-containing protein [Candidatus Hydrogenedentales bacterium]